MIRMRAESERGTLLMQRHLPVHWRFQQLLGFPEDTTNDGLYQWCLAVQTAIREVLGRDHPLSEDMRRYVPVCTGPRQSSGSVGRRG